MVGARSYDARNRTYGTGALHDPGRAAVRPRYILVEGWEDYRGVPQELLRVWWAVLGLEVKSSVGDCQSEQTNNLIFFVVVVTSPPCLRLGHRGRLIASSRLP